MLGLGPERGEVEAAPLQDELSPMNAECSQSTVQKMSPAVLMATAPCLQMPIYGLSCSGGETREEETQNSCPPGPTQRLLPAEHRGEGPAVDSCHSLHRVCPLLLTPGLLRNTASLLSGQGQFLRIKAQPNRSLISPVALLDDSYSCERLWASGSFITGGVSGWASFDEGYLQNLIQGCGGDGSGGEKPTQTLTLTCPSSGFPANPLCVAWPDHPPPGKGWSGQYLWSCSSSDYTQPPQ